MVYTPPTYSDHIGVAAVFKLQIGPVQLATDAATRRARPYLSQARISDFVKRPNPGSQPPASGHSQLFAAFKSKQGGKSTGNANKAKGKSSKVTKPGKRGTAQGSGSSSKTPKLTTLFQRK